MQLRKSKKISSQHLEIVKYRSVQLRRSPLKMLNLNETAVSMTNCALKCNAAYKITSRYNNNKLKVPKLDLLLR